MPPKPYCGAKRPIPPGTFIDEPFHCYRKGIRVGFKAGIDKGQETQRRVGRVHTELTRRQAHQQIVNDIHNKGLAALKRDLRLDQLNKDEIRSIAVRLTGTRDMIPNYSRMTKDQLVEALVNVGFRR